MPVADREGCRAPQHSKGVKAALMSHGVQRRKERLHHGLMQQVALTVDHHGDVAVTKLLHKAGGPPPGMDQDEHVARRHRGVRSDRSFGGELHRGTMDEGSDPCSDQLVFQRGLRGTGVLEGIKRNAKVLDLRRLLCAHRHEPFQPRWCLRRAHGLQPLWVRVPVPVHSA